MGLQRAGHDWVISLSLSYKTISDGNKALNSYTPLYQDWLLLHLVQFTLCWVSESSISQVWPQQRSPGGRRKAEGQCDGLWCRVSVLCSGHVQGAVSAWPHGVLPSQVGPRPRAEVSPAYWAGGKSWGHNESRGQWGQNKEALEQNTLRCCESSSPSQS